MNATIRPAEIEDADEIARVHVAGWREGYRGYISEEVLRDLSEEEYAASWRDRLDPDGSERSRVAVAERDGDVVGFVHCGPYRDDDLEDFDPGEIYALYVDPSEWRRGVGSDLLRDAVEFMGEASYEFAALWVLEANDRARAFYETAGFVPDQTWKTKTFRGVDLEVTRYRGVLP